MPAGRKRIEINAEEFKKLCALQCTQAEIASWFKCSPDTIERWCERELHQKFAEAYKIHSVDGKISLRRFQFRQAEKSPTMAIWLGKQWLGQTDRALVEVQDQEKDLLSVALEVLEK